MSVAPVPMSLRRARAAAESAHMRRMVREHGRLPNCAPGRLPLDRLVAWVERNDPPELLHRAAHDRRTGGACLITPERYVVDLVGLDRSIVQRWRRDGLTVADADRAAIVLGTHPVLIWPEFFDVTRDPLAMVEA